MSERQVWFTIRWACVCVLLLAGCGKTRTDPAEEAPPPTSVTREQDVNLLRVERPERFPLIAATAHEATSTLNVTGTVNPDVSREIPVISIASGRVVAIHVRLGDYVRKGQLIMEVQSTDISGAYNNYLKALSDEHLANTQLERAKLLYDKGAIAKSQLEIAQDGEDDAKANLVAAEEQLHVLGVDKTHPGETVKVYSPAIVIDNFAVDSVYRLTDLPQANLRALRDRSNILHADRSPGLRFEHDVFDISNISHQANFTDVHLLLTLLNKLTASIGIICGELLFNLANDTVEGVVLLQKGDDSDQALEGIHAKVKELNDQVLPPGVKIVPFLDRSDLLHYTTHTVLHNLTEGIVLVVIILFFFLGNVRGALIVSITIPFALLFASICLDLRHIPANLLSLGALDWNGSGRCGRDGGKHRSPSEPTQ